MTTPHPEPSPSQRDETGVVVPNAVDLRLAASSLSARAYEAERDRMARDAERLERVAQYLRALAAAPTPAQGGEAEEVPPCTDEECTGRCGMCFPPELLPAPSAPGAEVMRLREALERQHRLLRAVQREWHPAAKSNRITPGLHDAVGNIVAFCREDETEGAEEVGRINLRERAQEMVERIRQDFGWKAPPRFIGWLTCCLAEVVANDDPAGIRAALAPNAAPEEVSRG